MKAIDLETMSGGDFETLCREILSKYYGVEVEQTPLVGDGGKDLIIRSSPPVYVECKLHKQTIGRPVVQKLHSAMNTDFVKKGMIIATGGFSPQAKEHIRANGLPIELVDGEKLREMAEKVGIKLYFGSDVNIPEFCTTGMDYKDVERQYWHYIESHFVSHPKSLMDIIKVEGIGMNGYTVVYCYDFTIKQDFMNSKKDLLLKTLNESGRFCVDAATLAPVTGRDAEFLNRGTIVPMSEVEWDMRMAGEGHIRIDIERAVYEGLIERYTSVVKYRPQNSNRIVEKTLKPNKSNIQLSNLRIIYVPRFHISASSPEFRADLDFRTNGIEYLTKPEFGQYTSLVKDSGTKLAICDACGKIADSHTTRKCNLCGRLLCAGCSLRYKTGFLSKSPICQQCAKAHPELKIKRSGIVHRGAGWLSSRPRCC